MLLFVLLFVVDICCRGLLLLFVFDDVCSGVRGGGVCCFFCRYCLLFLVSFVGSDYCWYLIGVWLAGL